jgi:plasmid maintenance system antidote protein VapI
MRYKYKVTPDQRIQVFCDYYTQQGATLKNLATKYGVSTNHVTQLIAKERRIALFWMTRKGITTNFFDKAQS